MTGPDRFAGCLLGLALGDASGAPFEGGPLERLLWKAVGRTRDGRIRWTDDTQMALDVAHTLIDRGRLDADDLARRFAASYRWSRGYGPGTARLLKRIRRGEHWRLASRAVCPGGSFGNGAAMRVPAIGLFYGDRPGELREAAALSAVITHAHPLGVEGAVMMASAVAAAARSSSASEILQAGSSACAQAEFAGRLALASSWLETGALPGPPEVQRKLGNGIAACESCVTALYAALRFLGEPFGEMTAFIVRCRGDVDTIGSMAGAVWGAARGASALPARKLAVLEERDRIERVALALWERAAAER